ncbi:MAG: class I mannose-6-phosphate isomerase [Opitutales bacterium]|nr:class I mannose-6-phosphate isomerase [Opitutales bacterium]
MTIIKFEPIYRERPWGGTLLGTFFEREIKLESNKVGESWDIVDRNEAQSIALNDSYKGMPLREIISNNCNTIMGPSWHKESKFPILVKWLDCHERLSLQVHPPVSIASSLQGEPKTENWYVANATEDAGLFIGLKKASNSGDFKKALADKDVENLCHRIKSKEGDSVLVESGRIHAIDKGNLILEIQQNSDTTYRVYDWGRVDQNNRSRTLHIEESLKSINFNDTKPAILNTQNSEGILTLANCKFFRIKKYSFEKGTKLNLKVADIDCSIVHLISGSIQIGTDLIKKGEQVLSPFSSECDVTLLTDSVFLVTDQFVNDYNQGGLISN